MISIILTFILTGTQVAVSVPAECVDWFKASRVKSTDKECVSRCINLSLGMATFTCSEHCDLFCEKAPQKIYNLFGVCPSEFTLFFSKNESANKVNDSASRAKELTERKFLKNRQDDESDAFRHFVWAALSAQSVGREDASNFLEAHESCEGLNFGTEMDRSNNEQGLEFWKTRPKFTEDELIKEGLRKIKHRELIVIKPRRKI